MMLVMGSHGGGQHAGIDLKTANAMLGRVRNMSGGSTGSMESDLSRSWGSSTSSLEVFRAASDNLVHVNTVSSTSAPHSISQSSTEGAIHSTSSSSSSQSQLKQQVVNPGRYKTEMCRPFNETGHCKYGEKCQFAHGGTEMRGLPRHPKYKTELCRTFHSVGFCPYGPRCHFIHSEDEYKLVEISQMKQQQAAQQAAKEVAQQAAQIQAQQQALQVQISVMLSQVQHQITSQVSVTSPTLYPQMSVEQPVPSCLGSTADSPPESPVGSLNDEVFQQTPPVCHQPMEFFPAPNIPGIPVPFLSQLPPQVSTTAAPVAQQKPPVNVENQLTSIIGGLRLENSFIQHHSTTFSSQTAMNSTVVTTPQVLQDPSPPSSPDSLCSSMDSNRGSRLPIFSMLAADRS